MQKYLLIVFFLLHGACTSSSELMFVNRKIVQSQKATEIPKKTIKFYSQIRKDFIKENLLDSLQIDSLFLLESFYFEDGQVYGFLQANQNTWSYLYYKDTFRVMNIPVFPDVMISAVRDADIFCDTNQQNILYPVQSVLMTRVVKDEIGNYIIQSKKCDLFDELNTNPSLQH